MFLQCFWYSTSSLIATEADETCRSVKLGLSLLTYVAKWCACIPSSLRLPGLLKEHGANFTTLSLRHVYISYSQKVRKWTHIRKDCLYSLNVNFLLSYYKQCHQYLFLFRVMVVIFVTIFIMLNLHLINLPSSAEGTEGFRLLFSLCLDILEFVIE
jgi:hypothetical protein